MVWSDRILKRIVALGMLLATVVPLGCATPAGLGRCRARVVVQATETVNLDRAGQSLPTPVRFYQLKDVKNLKSASFEDMWTHAEETLGDDLVDVQEVVVYPSQKHSDAILIKEDATYFVAAAIFREPSGSAWRTYTRLPAVGTVKRCAENKPGGPYYFLLDRSTIRGSVKPIVPETEEEEDKR
jgi:type VI secretion system VasD/TssJ family lipoprotein